MILCVSLQERSSRFPAVERTAPLCSRRTDTVPPHGERNVLAFFCEVHVNDGFPLPFPKAGCAGYRNWP